MEKYYEVIFNPKGSSRCIRQKTHAEDPEEAKDNIRKKWKIGSIREVNEIPDDSGELFDLLKDLSDLNVSAYLDRLDKLGY